MKKFAAVLACLLATHAFAADQVVKESLTPPPAADAITPDKLPPVLTGIKPVQAPAKKKLGENDQPTNPLDQYNNLQEPIPS